MPLTFEADASGERICAELFVKVSLNQTFAAGCCELILILIEPGVTDVRRRIIARTTNIRLKVLIHAAEQRTITVVATRRRLDENLRTIAKRHAITLSRTLETIFSGCIDRATDVIVVGHIFRFENDVIWKVFMVRLMFPSPGPKAKFHKPPSTILSRSEQNITAKILFNIIISLFNKLSIFLESIDAETRESA